MPAFGNGRGRWAAAHPGTQFVSRRRRSVGQAGSFTTPCVPASHRLHIMDEPAVAAMFTGVSRVLGTGGLFRSYGPMEWRRTNGTPMDLEWIKEWMEWNGLKRINEWRPKAPRPMRSRQVVDSPGDVHPPALTPAYFDVSGTGNASWRDPGSPTGQCGSPAACRYIGWRSAPVSAP